jgi:AraC-like DNA-binding protein
MQVSGSHDSDIPEARVRDDASVEHAGPATRCQVTGALLRRVADAGGDARALAEAHGLAVDAVGAAETPISVEVRARLFDAAAELLGDPLLGIHLVGSFERGHFGILEYVISSAPTVRDAHVQLCRYGSLLNPRIRFSWTDMPDGRAILRHHLSGITAGRHVQELTIAGLLAGMRRAVGAAWRVERVWFTHPEPPQSQQIQDLLGAPRIEFDAADNGYLLPAGTADLPLASADARLAALIRQQVDSAMIGQPSAPDLVGDVRAAIRASLAQRGQVLAQVAIRLRTSTRTLQRRLQDTGVRFHDLLAEVRREESLRLVQTTNRSLTDVALDLGYSDLTNFLRAFRRWTGTTPGQVRKRR